MAEDRPAPRAQRNLLTILLVILAFNHMDRLALGVFLQDVKADLSLSDSQLGFLTGFAFALFYAAMGIPIARWADRGNRVWIIALSTALWSFAVALCGLAASYVQLLLIRVVAAVGEAGCQPPALSLIADYFDRAARPKAVARYLLGWPLALMLGYVAAGWLNDFYGWRVAFFVLGAPGLILALVAWFILEEPRRRETVSAGMPPMKGKDLAAALWRSKPYRHLLLCFSVWGFFGYGILQWQPAFFIRSHGLATGELGTWLAIVYGGGGLIGTLLGGELATRFAANDEGRQLKGMAVLYAVFAVFAAAAYLAPNQYVAFAILALSALGGAMINGPLFSAVQGLVPAPVRGTATAVMFFFCNLIGMGLGPWGVGLLSEALTPEFGDEALRYALIVFCPGYFWAAWHAWQASRTARDVAAAYATTETPVRID